MKALVLAGGSGTRLRPLTYTMPKQLIPVANKPVLRWVLENIRDAGITEVAVIVAQWPSVIADTIGDGAAIGIRITYIHQERPLGLAHCVRLAGDFLGADDFVLYLGDNMLSDGIGEAAARFTAEDSAVHLLVRKVADPRAFGVAEIAADGRVTGIEEKPAAPKSDLAVLGLYFFTPAVHEAVRAVVPSARGELEITDAISWLIARGDDVRATEYTGSWQDVGSVDDVLACNRRQLSELSPRIDGRVDAASVVSGRVVVAEGAVVIRSTIVGPAIVGADSVIEDSHVGPDSSVGAGCVIRDSRLADVVMLDGSSVRGVDGLRASVIGRSATVSAATDDKYHRVVLGDSASVEVAA